MVFLLMLLKYEIIAGVVWLTFASKARDMFLLALNNGPRILGITIV